MKPEQKPVADLLAQLLTTDYGGAEHKRGCLLRLLQDPRWTQEALKILGEDPLPLMRPELKVPGQLPEPIQLHDRGPLISELVLLDRAEGSSRWFPRDDHQATRPSESEFQTLQHAIAQFPRAWGLTGEETLILFTQKDALSHVLGIWEALFILIPNRQALAWVKTPNDAPLFAGDPPLSLMLNGKLGEVRNHLFARLNVW